LVDLLVEKKRMKYRTAFQRKWHPQITHAWAYCTGASSQGLSDMVEIARRAIVSTLPTETCRRKRVAYACLQILGRRNELDTSVANCQRPSPGSNDGQNSDVTSPSRGPSNELHSRFCGTDDCYLGLGKASNAATSV